MQYVMDERRKGMMLMLYCECKSWRPHTCMYVTCIGILLRYVMLVRIHTFVIYVCHDIMRAFRLLWHSVTCNVLCLTKPGPGGMYTSSPSESMCACVGRV